MNKKLMMALLFSAFTASVFAQPETEDKKPEKKKIKKEESITIRKKGGTTEKVTVVVDGDKVTVNGKPMDEFKEENIEIVRGGGGDRMTTIKRLNGRAMASADKLREIAIAGMPNNKAVLGVSTEKTEQGAKITEVSKESAAEKAGLKTDDVITKLNATKIEDADALYKAVGKYKPEEKVTITYLRNGKEETTTAALGKNKMDSYAYSWNDNYNFEMPELPELQEMPEIATAPGSAWGGQNFAFAGFPRKPKLGLQVQDIEEGKGVKILEVDAETPAAKAGLKKDDVITKVNETEVAGVDEVKAATKTLKEGDTLKITYTRDGKSQTTDIKFPKKLKTAGL
jgi:serine protease Do